MVPRSVGAEQVADDAIRFGGVQQTRNQQQHRVIFLVLVLVCSHTIVRFDILTTVYTVHTVNINHHRLFSISKVPDCSSTKNQLIFSLKVADWLRK